MSENEIVNGAELLEDSGMEAVVSEAGLAEELDIALEISEGVKTTPCESSEEKEEEQKDEPDVCLSTLDSELEEWSVGAACCTVWSEDGLVYPATIISMEGERCRVQFDDYGNEEDVQLSALQKRPDISTLTSAQQPEDWKPGSRCRAVYSGDGWVYPAVVLKVEGQRCHIRFDTYDNEEEQDVKNLLKPNELHGGSFRKILEVKKKQRGSETSPVKTEVQQDSSTQVKEEENSREEEVNQKKDAPEEKPTKPNLPLQPPLLSPQLLNPTDLSSIFSSSPPPPPFSLMGEEGDNDAASKLLMLWYTCGFHTGCYMTRQTFRSNSKDSEQN